jgi:hypothetical protein
MMYLMGGMFGAFATKRLYCKKSRKTLRVIPAKAGIHFIQILKNAWIPAFAGMTTFCSDVTKSLP